MDETRIRRLLKRIEKGSLTAEEALKDLKSLPYEEVSRAVIDHHRALRTSIPEVIFAGKKKTSDIVDIARAMMRQSGKFLITRANKEIYEALGIKKAEFHADSGIISYGAPKKKQGFALVLSAGASDIPVAEEAALTASFLGSKTECLCDVGVAGLHRLLAHKKSLDAARVVVVVAGMEGALPSLVGGLIDKPLIAVPTSVGYGSSFGGLTALFSMLNSCVPGIAVMNIDNGFGAGCLAHRINTMR
jgi:NCAIR mutase (PurE)-related protein